MLELIRMADQAGQEARPALRRPEAARRHRPRAGQQARRPAPRRAAGRARPQAPPAHAHRARRDPRRGRHHLPLRHPRPGRGHEPERPHRGDERRPRRADRHAGRDLRVAADELRRRLHRRHQLPRGPGPRQFGRRVQPARDRGPAAGPRLQRQVHPGGAAHHPQRPAREDPHLPRRARDEAPAQRLSGRHRGRDLPRLEHEVLGPDRRHRIQVLRQHDRFFLDERPLRWKEECWIWWHADDGFMLDRFGRAGE